MDIIAYRKANKALATAEQLSSGIDHYEVDGLDLKIYPVGGGSPLVMTFTQPADGVSITGVEVDANNHLIITYSEGSPEVAGTITTLKGDKGDKGETGDTGADGKSFTIKAQYPTEAALIEAHPTGQEGDAYFVGDDANPDLYIWLSDDSEWYNAGKIAGIKGDKGDPGEGVPAGGTTGQVLTKKSGSDYDAEWKNPAGGGALDNLTDTDIDNPADGEALVYDGTSGKWENKDLALGTAAALDVPASGDASTTEVVKGDDSRLTDARTPVSHTHTLSQVTDAGTAAAKDSTNTITQGSTDLIESGAVYTGLAGKVDTSSVGTASGVAELDAYGKVPASQLPSYVDDVVEGYYKEADGKFYEESTYETEIAGEADKIYISKDTNIQYRWTGSAFAALGGALQLGETSSTAYRGDRGKTAYDFSQAPYASNPAMNGTASPGSSTAWAKGDHVHPSDTSKADKSTVDGILNGQSIDSFGDVETALSGKADTSDIPDITGKADKVTSAVDGNFAALDSNGNLIDSEHKHSDYLTQHQDITGKADKVSNATDGNFAGLDSNGNLTDSGISPSDLGSGHTIIDGDGNTMPQRSKLKFENSDVVDDAVHDVTIITPETFTLVSWSSGTDAQIATMICMYYNGLLTINDIKSVWSVGQSRTVSLSAMAATGVGESHRAQEVEYTIIDFEHDDLATPINGHSKALITIQQKNYLRDANVGDTDGANNTEGGYIHPTNDNTMGWTNCARRTWCNNIYYNALPTYLKNLVKEITHSTTIGNKSATLRSDTDKCFLLSEYETGGDMQSGETRYSCANEGTQYKFYETRSNIDSKKPTGTSGAIAIAVFRSPCNANSTGFCCLYLGEYNYINWGLAGASNSQFQLAPAMCL